MAKKSINAESERPKNNLRSIRDSRGLTQDEVARMVNPPTTKSQISKLENLSLRLNDIWVSKLCEALGVTPDTLMMEGVPVSGGFKPVDHDLMSDIARAIERVANKRGLKMSKEQFLDLCVELYNYVQDYRSKSEKVEINAAMVEIFMDLKQRAAI
jgi:transcriptional regulator with XRE-family HTH domain